MLKYSHKAMDTAFTLTVNCGDEELAASAAQTCFDRIDTLELILSRFHDTSDVAVIRNLVPGEYAVVARETIDLLVECARICAATGGAFDPTVEKRNFGDLIIDTTHCRIAAKSRVELDFGGIGKGFALDECRKILESEQYALDDWLFDAGTSTILAAGGPWKLGVGGPFKSRSHVSPVVEISGIALSGSGFEIQGAHVWDVRKGIRETLWAQSWALAQTGTIADALTTAALSLTPAELHSAAQALQAEILIARKQPRWMDCFRDPLKWISCK
jgi:thiamine biosynthesis lipoprotein ApbE